MHYYHIVVETNDRDVNKKFIKLYEYDRENLSEIKSDVLKPYVLKEEIYFDGAYLKSENIRSLKVKKSERTSSELVKIANDNVPANVFIFISTEDVISEDGYVEDVTRGLIREIKEEIAQLTCPQY